MQPDLVIGIDSSTTATKAVAFDRMAGPWPKGARPHPMQTPKPGWFEQNAEDWWASTSEALRQLTSRIDRQRFAGSLFPTSAKPSRRSTRRARRFGSA